jgi:hypothetical protein
MRSRRRFLPYVLLVGVLVSCAASQRESTIKAALVTADATRDAFLAYDSDQQTAIVAKATSLDDGRAQLAAYRARRAKVQDALDVTYRAIAVAVTLNDVRSLETLQAALGQVTAALADLKGAKP